jgi:hypothetical protein
MGSIQAKDGKKEREEQNGKWSKRTQSFYRPLAVSLTFQLLLPDRVEAEAEAYMGNVDC